MAEVTDSEEIHLAATQVPTLVLYTILID
jgi:hypothetical protein